MVVGENVPLDNEIIFKPSIMKKKILAIVASTLMLLGTGAIAFVTMVSWEAVAQARVAVFFGNKIPCYSSGSTTGDGRYTDCPSCMSVPGIADNGPGKCKPR